MSNRVIEDDQIQCLNDSEFRAFVYLICLASQANKASIFINLEKAERISNIKIKVFLSTIEKLCDFNICTRSVRDPYAIRTDAVRDPTATLQDKTRQDITERESSGDDRLPRLAKVWNVSCGNLAKVKSTNNARDRKSKARYLETTEEEWVQVIGLVAKSDFCNGKNDRGWRATFDWILQPETRLKVLEGKYQNRAAKEKTKESFPLNNWSDLAGKLILAVRRFPSGDERLAESLGSDWEWISRSGLMSTIRAMKDDDFSRKRLANDLRAASERLLGDKASEL